MAAPKKALTKSQIVAHFAEKFDLSKKSAGMILDEVATRIEILSAHCTAVGRDYSTIELTASFPIVIRNGLGAAESAFNRLLAHNGLTAIHGVPVLVGAPDMIADRIRPYRDLGFRTIIVRLPAPHDRETIERIGEVAALLAD